MTKGGRNRLIVWAGFGIPYRPEKTDLLETTRRVQGVLADGWVDRHLRRGRIHRGERDLLPLAEGTAFFALRSGRADRPDRDQRDELARVPADDPGPGGGAHPARGPRVARVGGGLTRATEDALLASSPTSRPAAAGHARALAHRGVQRLAGGPAARARGGRTGGPTSPRAGPATGADARGACHPARGLIRYGILLNDHRPSRRPRGSHRPLRRPDRVPRPARGPARRPDRHLGLRADARRRQAPRHRAGRRGLPPSRQAERARIRTGVRFRWRPARDGRGGCRGPT